MNQDGAIRDAKKLGVPKMLILGLQHMFAMFGATILVPILVNNYFYEATGENLSRGLTVSVTLFCLRIIFCVPGRVFHSGKLKGRNVC